MHGKKNVHFRNPGLVQPTAKTLCTHLVQRRPDDVRWYVRARPTVGGGVVFHRRCGCCAQTRIKYTHTRALLKPPPRRSFLLSPLANRHTSFGDASIRAFLNIHTRDKGDDNNTQYNAAHVQAAVIRLMRGSLVHRRRRLFLETRYASGLQSSCPFTHYIRVPIYI